VSVSTVAERLRALADRLTDFPSPRVQRIMMLVAVPALVVGAVVSYRTLDLDLAEVRWGHLALAGLLGGPVSATVAAWEFRLSAAMVGHRIGLWQALRVTIVANALNYLPGHGGALWRVQSIRRMGSGYSGATSVTLLLALVWLGLAGLTAGGLLLAHGPAVAAWAFAGLGLLGLLLAAVMLRQHHRGAAAAGWGARVAMVETCSIVVAVARLYVVLLALGHRSGITAAVVLALAGIIASATGIMRGGLGLRELLAGAFAPLVGLAVGLGFLASAVDRLVGTIARVPLALLLYANYGSDHGVHERPVDAANG